MQNIHHKGLRQEQSLRWDRSADEHYVVTLTFQGIFAVLHV